MKKKHGFTLIEILVVLLIISIVSSVAMFSIRANDKRDAEVLSKKIINILSLAEVNAILLPATYLVTINENTIFFAKYEPLQKSHWQIIHSGPLKPFIIPKKFHLQTENREIIINSDASLTPFILYIGKKNAAPYYEITAKLNGEIIYASYKAE